MKKTVLFFSLILLAALSSADLQSQDASNRTRLALMAEPHLNWLNTDAQGIDQGSIRAGFGGGLRLEHYFQTHYAFSWGVQFNQTGGNLLHVDTLFLNRITGTDTLRPGTTLTYNLQYVEFPLAIRFLTREIGYTILYSEFGLDPAINTRAYLNASDNNIKKDPWMHEIAGFNLAYHASIGIMYSFSRNLTLLAGLSYKNNFLDITRDGGFLDPDNVRFNQVGLNLGLIF